LKNKNRKIKNNKIEEKCYKNNDKENNLIESNQYYNNKEENNNNKEKFKDNMNKIVK
jgi:hypothetical protein